MGYMVKLTRQKGDVIALLPLGLSTFREVSMPDQSNTHGLQIVKEWSPTKGTGFRVLVRCVYCGQEREMWKSYALRQKSCGCRARSGNEWKVTHGHYRLGKGSPTYRSWIGMKNRCADPKREYYRNITVCERWIHSFENFLTDMGERPKGTSLDRWPDPSGNYEPSNCRWATPFEQIHNRRPRKTNARI